MRGLQQAQGIYWHAGKLRDYSITKKQWVLAGATKFGYAQQLE